MAIKITSNPTKAIKHLNFKFFIEAVKESWEEKKNGLSTMSFKSLDSLYRKISKKLMDNPNSDLRKARDIVRKEINRRISWGAVR